MEIVEIRVLDGPNVFLPAPAIKVEFANVEDADLQTLEDAVRAVEADVPEPVSADPPNREIGLVARSLLLRIVSGLHVAVGEATPENVAVALESPGHHAVAYAWSHRAFATHLAKLARELVSAPDDLVDLPERINALRAMLTPPFAEDDAPEMIRDAARSIPIVAVTGTNGKTTTTRLISAILRKSGRKVGWCSSVGVYIEGDLVLEGDYTGPSGAARVFAEPDLDVAVLETARGGILLRGLGYESNDVSVVTNISADHLGLHGIHTVEGLARVKQVVPSATRAGGFAVLNADDDRVLAMREGLKAQPFLISRSPDNVEVEKHVGRGGWALSTSNDEVRWWHDDQVEPLVAIDQIPITFGGRAAHMLENALSAAAACLALGLEAASVRDGLEAFRNRSDQNRARLNAYKLNDITVIVDFAHNEAGLRNLLGLARALVVDQGQVTAVIGTAGDRDDDALRGLATLGATDADRTIIKDVPHYLRGRELGEMPRIMREAYRAASHDDPELAADERAGFDRALELSRPGDVIAIMCLEDYNSILEQLDRDGEPIS